MRGEWGHVVEYSNIIGNIFTYYVNYIYVHFVVYIWKINEGKLGRIVTYFNNR